MERDSKATPRKINHIGIAVRDLEAAIALWQTGLGLDVQRVVEMPERGLKIAFVPCGEATIELVAPLGEGSEISKFLDERGPGLHHLCLEVEDLALASQAAEQQGLRLIGAGAKLGAEGYPVRFVHPKSTGGPLVELLGKSE